MRPLWRCPRCGRSFASSNQTRACGRWTVAAFLAGKGTGARRHFRAFRRCDERCGPVRLAPARTRLGFQVRRIFAAVNRLAEDRLDGHLVLARRVDGPLFHRIETLSPTCHVHHFRIAGESDLDDEFEARVREAYEIGTQARLESR